MIVTEFNKLIARIEKLGYSPELAGNLATAIGSTPEINMDGNITVILDGIEHEIPWEVYEDDE